MTKTFILSIATVAILAGANTVQAGPKFGLNAQERWKQQQILNEEWRRAREVGGYNDPITAFTNLFRGEATEKDLRQGVNTIQDTPAIGTVRLKSRWD